ncbi:MAG: phosphoribosylformylglycinamidine synthase subunit PurQ [Rhodospirillaceae bacterium]|jgi:phosphoribosylformylglycinamidine synthase|nr:phosphoribosylformylglycinamidine synthase subunit PurQ [Rhodospirillaceae bacterium]MBT3910541.1 phosphoribosylformylglycinamidine synthase subunit PurQ [Rhodospirillaceae bacterium]MBT5297149.1 phosphoribosylformylglycinamidine synthase subunit PurQ [Rhodospirillaceae bacterium]MBT5513283.1 phosphoribosylformylglycinamidine synthase subunit PurQ [Rhodospirillaceae bacterium]MBT6087066.1 phosphoribosylformylglycinamidine synthase subunit PurQ [Rhodospirillaceae bacterium]
MKAAVIVFPGSNCDRDLQVALRSAMGAAPKMVWHGDSDMPDVDLIAVPGGFSYGDYLRSGAMAAKSPIMKEVVARAGKGVPVLGICNGFQVLTEAGLLPGALMRNAQLKYICKDVLLKVAANDTAFTQAYDQDQVIRIPIAHHDGNYFADDDTLNELEDDNRVAFRYCDAAGTLSEDANPNGSQRAIAGIFNKNRNVLGMMPHPERLADAKLGGADGKPMFDGLVQALG